MCFCSTGQTIPHLYDAGNSLSNGWSDVGGMGHGQSIHVVYDMDSVNLDFFILKQNKQYSVGGMESESHQSLLTGWHCL